MKGKVFIGDNSNVPIYDIGELRFIRNGQGGWYSSSVLYVLDLGYHLLSVKGLCRLGLLVEFFRGSVLDQG